MEKIRGTPIYQHILNDLLGLIESGRLRSGDKIPTEKELMAQYGTSRITTSRALKELENLGYLVRIKAKGSFITPKSAWKNGQSQEGSKPTISMVLLAPAGKISLELEVIHGAEIAGRERGYNLSVHTIDIHAADDREQRAREKSLINDILNDGSSGVVIYPCSTFDSPEIYNRMACKSFPFVLLDRKVFGVEAPLVSSDNRGGFQALVDHLVDWGHRRIAFVSGNTYESSCRSERYAGYVQAMTEHRLTLSDDYIEHNLFPSQYRNTYYGDIETRNYALREAIKGMLDRFMYLPEPPSAISSSNDYIALNIMNVARDMGIRIPEDLSLTGFDGLEICSYVNPRLTTVAQNFSLLGQTTVTLLDSLIRDPQRRVEEIRIDTKLVLGESVRRL